MFKKITIHLTEPICSCDEQALGWDTWKDEKDQSCLILVCRKCKTQLRVPNCKFVASWDLDRKYPAETKKKNEENKKELNIDSEKNNILPFRKQNTNKGDE